MEKIINKDNLRNFAYINEAMCSLPIKGIVLNFSGLGGMAMYDSDTVEGEFYGEKGVLYVVPYYNPWSWMNIQTVAFVDEIIDVVIKKYGLNENIPVISSGESMGGQSALVYCVYAKRTPVACVVNCPVCDTSFHYTERTDLPRTLYSALWQNEGSLEHALKTISPIHLINKMPAIEYHIFHCGNDKAVNKSYHSDIFVEAMRKAGHSLSYDIVPNRGHCDIGYSMKKLYAKYILDAIEKSGN